MSTTLLKISFKSLVLQRSQLFIHLFPLNLQKVSHKNTH
ncbi:hypothetical protein XO28_0025 [Bacillus phage phi4J1]|uniref:Uncharacterized protein n=1 Tax=Bacillus phage phi4J1 TaxID=1643326 RepID=A0A0S2MVF9_9CAUD|nr:hypothetical protein XO28_0025 [Bacillus phage phi4J1]ALO79865.1 hypothetical protein XO28_0025 [Bacillus phage phi4J1]